MWILPLDSIHNQLCKASSNPRGKKSPQISPDEIVWAVTIASQYIPRSTCLAQALTAQIMLSKAHYPSNLRIGVARYEEGQLEAHAWLESDGGVINSGSGIERYTKFPIIKREAK